MKDYYQILGIDRNSSIEEIRAAYKKLSKKFHPDLNDGDKFFEEKFKELQDAYDVLTGNDSKKKFEASTSSYNDTKISKDGTDLDSYISTINNIIDREIDEIERFSSDDDKWHSYLFKIKDKYYKVSYSLEVGTTFKNGKILSLFIGNSKENLKREIFYQTDKESKINDIFHKLKIKYLKNL